MESPKTYAFVVHLIKSVAVFLSHVILSQSDIIYVDFLSELYAQSSAKISNPSNFLSSSKENVTFSYKQLEEFPDIDEFL